MCKHKWLRLNDQEIFCSRCGASKNVSKRYFPSTTWPYWPYWRYPYYTGDYPPIYQPWIVTSGGTTTISSSNGLDISSTTYAIPAEQSSFTQ